MKFEEVKKKTLFVEKLDWEQITLYSMYALAILVPAIIGKPQILVGSVINFLLVFSTLKYGVKRTLPIMVLPSIVAITTGILFDGATYFLFYLTPFIMISNFILSYFVSKKKTAYILLAIFLKGIFLLAVYVAFVNLIGLPTIFVSSAYLQFLTAGIGALAGLTLYDFSRGK